MIDLTKLLADWEYNPKTISVRKLLGLDGRDKLQMRVDLGVLQMECEGRPDGQSVKISLGEDDEDTKSFPSYLELVVFLFQQHEQQESVTQFHLNPETVHILRREASQFQERCTAFEILSEWEPALRDVQHCIAILDMVRDYADAALTLEDYRVYLLSKRARIQATLEISQEEIPSAIAHVKRAILEIQQHLADCTDGCDDAVDEIAKLQKLIAELRAKIPAGTILAVHSELRDAINQGKRRKASTLRRKLNTKLGRRK